MARPRARLTRGARGGLVVAALALASLLVVAALLRPSPSGRGTHRQLGLPPCRFLSLTGRPCPSCGMTTAFAWVVRGRSDLAWRANPAGSLLAPLCGLGAAWFLACAAAGRPVGSRTVAGPSIVVVLAIVAVTLVSWTIRLLSGRAL